MAGPDPDGDETAEARAARRLRMLKELAEIGMGLARNVGGPASGVADPGLAFSRIARAVRQTLALEARFDEEGQARAQEVAAQKEKAQAIRALHRQMLIDDVRTLAGRVIRADASESGREHEVERLLADLDERLEDAEEDEAALFGGRSVAEQVGLICRDLGVKWDPALWEDWDLEEDEDEEGADDADASACWSPGVGWRATIPRSAYAGTSTVSPRGRGP
ncbi:MAG: hypothetical protein P4L73_17590 [Caulobacteraceae bacterium]|nr:hypothetical protein [Caulobacteraceae bacterium]